MKKIRKFLLPILCSAFALFLPACGFYTLDLTYFNTSVYVAANGKLENYKGKIENTLTEIENLLSVSSANSEITAFNAANANEAVNLSPVTEEVFSAALYANEFTKGAFNPAIYPALKLYKLSADTFDKNVISISPPAETEIESIKPNTNFAFVKNENGKLYKTQSGVEIDLGGIAKGYATDKIVEILSNSGIDKGYVSIGGSSIYVFETEENLSIKHPLKNGYIISVNSSLTKNSPLSTSGDYERYYTDVNDKNLKYSHIIDSKTCKPANTGIHSVTVIANGNLSKTQKSACFTDALSTALCTFTKTELIDFIKNELTEFSIFAVYEKNGVKEIISNRPLNEFEILDGEYSFIPV